MNTQQAPGIPKIQFRVLIIGRANAGKTSILQRICDTTDSPIIYRGTGWARKKVTLDPSMGRGEHSIDDELIFSHHKGYIFHDSRGIESGGIDELQILQQFIRRKCQETRLGNRLHAIWYCVPMDNQRPQLDLKFFKDICPDRNVPVVVVFTKYDQFRRNVQIFVEDFGSPDDNVLDVGDKLFQEHYLRPLGDDVVFVRLEKMHIESMHCDELIETTAAALNNDIVGLMLLAVQRRNLKLSVKTALKRVRLSTGSREIVRECLIPFPYIWFGKRSMRFLASSAEFSRLFEEFSAESPRSEAPVSFFAWVEFFFRRLGVGLDERLERLPAKYFLSPGSRLIGGNGLFDLSNFIRSLPTVRNLTQTSLHDYHLIFAVILILKHASFLRFSNMSAHSALTHAELDYQEANIDSRIQQYLAASSQEHSDELFADFIMAVDMTCTHIGVSGDGGR